MILAEKTESLAALIEVTMADTFGKVGVSDLRARVDTLESRVDALTLLLDRMGLVPESISRDGKEL